MDRVWRDALKALTIRTYGTWKRNNRVPRCRKRAFRPFVMVSGRYTSLTIALG
jgi:hypothetical protein